jgi:positive regulator of sigma E activity
MTNKKQKKTTKATAASRTREKIFETDGTYFLKLVVFALLGTLWLKFQQPMILGAVPVNGIPLGFLVGLLLVRKFEKYQADRKIWYAMLLVVTIICYFVPAGILL